MPPPLRDLFVVELGQYIAAPYAALVLADLGARVVKVEPPHGDGIRTWGPHPGGESAPFMAYNRNKESVTADLATPEGAALVEGLIARADVVIENNRPGVLERFGFDAASVRERHPSLIYCSITGYGTHSPYARRPGFDLVIQGVTGLMSVTGDESGELIKVGVPIVDGTASLHATTAIMAAVHERARTGEGTTIDISLQASTMTWMMLLGAGYFATGEEPKRIGSAHPFAAPYQAFETADAPLTIAAGNDRQWERLCGVLELGDVQHDPRFATNADRAAHQRELAAIVTERLRTRPRDQWIEALSAAGVPCGSVNTLAQALHDPALVNRDLVVSYEHPLAGRSHAIGNPIGWPGYRAPLRRPPLQGEHTASVTAEIGAPAPTNSDSPTGGGPVSTDAHLIVHRRDSRGMPQMAETRLERFNGSRTSVDDLFIVHHYDPPPADAVELGRIVLRRENGSVEPLAVADLQSLEPRKVAAVIECAGNGRQYIRHKAPGTQFGYGLVGLAEWEGVPLAALLESRGVSTDFRTLVVHGLDSGWTAPENKYARFGKGLPREKALDPETLLAWAVNGEPLPFEHGGPLRLVVPGWAGVWWVKWVHELAFSDEDFDGFWQNERYRYVDGAFAEPAVVRDQLPRALVVSPSDGDFVSAGEVIVAGKAWSGAGAITRVEVSTDGGRSWRDAELADGDSRWSWSDWTFAATLREAGVSTLSARATDATGVVQQWDGRHNRLGYGNNGIMTVTVNVRSG